MMFCFFHNSITCLAKSCLLSILTNANIEFSNVDNSSIPSVDTTNTILKAGIIKELKHGNSLTERAIYEI